MRYFDVNFRFLGFSNLKHSLMFSLGVLQSNYFFLANRSMFAFGDGTVAARMSGEHSPRGGVFGIGHATAS